MSRAKEEHQIVEHLSAIMLGKLRANSHKPFWGEGDSIDLMKTMRFVVGRAREELDELEAVIDALERGERATVSKVGLEAADVANMVAMAADCARRYYLARREEILMAEDADEDEATDG